MDCTNELLCVSGLVKTLHGLNITNNPLEFPPQDVIERGTYEIQKFLREMLQAKSSAKMNTVKDGLYDLLNYKLLLSEAVDFIRFLKTAYLGMLLVSGKQKCCLLHSLVSQE